MGQRLRLKALLALGGTAIALFVVPVSGGETPDPTLLVLQPPDVAGTSWKIQSAPQVTSDDRIATASAKNGRVSGAVATYQSAGLIGGLPGSLSSRAVVFRDATGAHGAFLEVAAKIAQKVSSSGSGSDIGQEGRSWEQSFVGIRNRNYWVLWRHGNVLALVEASGEPVVLKTQIVTLPQRQEVRIAALVPESNPGPPVVVKPVIGKPVAQPAQPRAGKRFRATFRITWSNDGTAVKTASAISSTTKIAGKTVAHAYRFSAGNLAVTLSVPKSAKHKKLQIAVKLRAEGGRAAKVVTYIVR